MKKNRLFLTLQASVMLAATAGLNVACTSNDEETAANLPAEIQLFTEIAGQTRAANSAADLQDTQFKNGTMIGVFMGESSADDFSDYTWHTYTCDGEGGLTTNGTVRFPTSGSSMEIYAVHPLSAQSYPDRITSHTDKDFNVRADQSSTENYLESDLMFAELNGVKASSSITERTLKFNHLLSKIIVKLQKGTGISDDEINSATITLGNDDMVIGGTFVIEVGSFEADPDGTGDATYTIATNAGTTEHAAIVVPQSVSGKKINVTIGGNTSSYTIPTGTRFEAGKKYTFTFTLTQSPELKITSTSITDWGTTAGWTDPNATIMF